MRSVVVGSLAALVCACSGPTGPDRAGSAAGTVTLDGAPLSGVTVELIGHVASHDPADSSWPYIEIDDPLAVVETGSDGSFRLEAGGIPKEACDAFAFVRLQWSVPLDYRVPSPCHNYAGVDFALSSGPAPAAAVGALSR